MWVFVLGIGGSNEWDDILVVVKGTGLGTSDFRTGRGGGH